MKKALLFLLLFWLLVFAVGALGLVIKGSFRPIGAREPYGCIPAVERVGLCHKEIMTEGKRLFQRRLVELGSVEGAVALVAADALLRDMVANGDLVAECRRRRLDGKSPDSALRNAVKHCYEMPTCERFAACLGQVARKHFSEYL